MEKNQLLNQRETLYSKISDANTDAFNLLTKILEYCVAENLLGRIKGYNVSDFAYIDKINPDNLNLILIESDGHGADEYETDYDYLDLQQKLNLIDYIIINILR